jgi:aspartyl-tRNA(Asn)/glutamyl-tRNA(Gln) amidotransferase subunit A
MTTLLHELPIEDAARRLAAREISSQELTNACLGQIARTEGEVGSFIEKTENLARLQAEKADQMLARGGDLPPLTGIPVALKDIFLTRGIRTTCASKILENFVPRFNGTVPERLNKAGAVLLGKLNMDEFAMGSSCENSALGVTRNPWDLSAVPGGSSGGSATAVAARQVLGTFGTDTGGSIRLPAAYCGVVGIKPTYGRVSRFGVIAFASSLDQVGPLANSVRGAAILLGAVAGHDPADSTSLPVPVPNYLDEIDQGVAGLRVGVPAEFFAEGLEPDVEASVRKALDDLKHLGCTLVDISLPHTQYAVATYYLIATAEASSNLGRYDGVRYGLRKGEKDGLRAMYEQTRDAGFGPEVKRRILLGTYALSAGYYEAYYLKAMKARTMIRQDFTEAFKSCDVIVGPTSPTTAFRAGSRSDDPIKMYLSDILTISANLAGLPGMSLPCGLDKKGLPIGLQILAPHLGESQMLRTAAAYESASDWKRELPPLAKIKERAS